MTEHNKETLLQTITQAAEQGLVSKREMLAAFNKGQHKKHPHLFHLQPSLNLTEVFASLGCGIIFLGIAILISENWNILSFTYKIALTLGSGVVAYGLGAFLGRDSRAWIISSGFFLLSALLIPFGMAVTIRLYGYDVLSFGWYSVISGIALVIFSISYLFFKKDFFLLFSILYATWCFYSVANYLNPGSTLDFTIYCTLVIGISYILLGAYFAKSAHYSLSGFLYGFGCLGLLGSLFEFDVMHPGSFYEWTFPLVLFIVIYASVLLKSTSFLTFGVIFLVLWIMEITNRYFSQSLGWPIALVIAGSLLIAIAYVYLQLKKKYFR